MVSESCGGGAAAGRVAPFGAESVTALQMGAAAVAAAEHAPELTGETRVLFFFHITAAWIGGRATVTHILSPPLLLPLPKKLSIIHRPACMCPEPWTFHHSQLGENATLFVKCDVSKVSDLQAVVDKTVEVYGRIDCLINNACVGGGVIPPPSSSIHPAVLDRITHSLSHTLYYHRCSFFFLSLSLQGLASATKDD